MPAFDSTSDRKAFRCMRRVPMCVRMPVKNVSRVRREPLFPSGTVQRNARIASASSAMPSTVSATSSSVIGLGIRSSSPARPPCGQPARCRSPSRFASRGGRMSPLATTADGARIELSEHASLGPLDNRLLRCIGRRSRPVRILPVGGVPRRTTPSDKATPMPRSGALARRLDGTP